MSESKTEYDRSKIFNIKDGVQLDKSIVNEDSLFQSITDFLVALKVCDIDDIDEFNGLIDKVKNATYQVSENPREFMDNVNKNFFIQSEVLFDHIKHLKQKHSHKPIVDQLTEKYDELCAKLFK